MFHVKHHPPDNSTIRLRFTWNTNHSQTRQNHNNQPPQTNHHVSRETIAITKSRKESRK